LLCWCLWPRQADGTLQEKQAEQIIEKLCQRFKLSGNDERQWRDIAFCLSMLPFKSDRSITRLVEALPEYQDKLYEPKVYARFQEILNKVRPIARHPA
jgi:condensin complex subunit 1